MEKSAQIKKRKKAKPCFLFSENIYVSCFSLCHKFTWEGEKWELIHLKASEAQTTI